MKWLEISVQCDGEAAEAVAELFNRFNSRPGEGASGAVIEVGGFDAFFDFGGKVVEVHVAGVAFVPHAGDTYLSLVHVGFGHAGAVEHGLGSALRLRLGDAGTVFV